jgi:hypothetical protein
MRLLSSNYRYRIAALDELRQKRPAQGGRQIPSGSIPDGFARASLG